MDTKRSSENRRKKTRENISFSLFIFFLLSGALLFNGCAGQEDVRFARQVMEQLIKGRYSARYMIDWSRFAALGSSIGSEYAGLRNDEEKTDYQRAFIDNFKANFKAAKGDPKAASHWRMFNGNDPEIKIVAADIGAGQGRIVMFFAVRHEKGRRKLVEIGALQVMDEAKFKAYEKEQENAAVPFNKT